MKETVIEFRKPPHNYLTHEADDRFAHLLKKLNSNEVKLDTANDKAFLTSILAALDIPVSSQILVFSASSLQSEIINPRNPRALYFNEDTYVGYVPNGKVEVISMDPTHAAIFYIFDRLRPGNLPLIARSEKCFNCHAGNATRRVPGLIAESLLPMASGASLETYRRDEQGHQIPLDQRFGGWHLTGGHHLETTHANLMGVSTDAGKFNKVSAEPGQMWNIESHLLPTSDILPNLVHEHQLGFENRVFHAAYVMRALHPEGCGMLPSSAKPEVEKLADELARYILFTDEAKLPAKGIDGDPAFARDFARNRKPTKGGASLKDFDLKNRLFKYRASYMLYTESWQKLPPALKERVYYKMAEGLRDQNPGPVGKHLPVEERHAIRAILKETLPGLPGWWR
ncbi:hypothetical protein BGE01nite_05880 [Brevifollis gellanilyticus]|uniref:Cytochrome c domain-containing protein n=1 Tax=Brevifollis gellanilyticus TaxID=748831 RepID=A0A512M3G7_9BACT|nr:hypothetical protein BGE01nite_05880 [Brevifollis gellanilyticus]